MKVNHKIYYSGTVMGSIPKMGIWDLGRLGGADSVLGSLITWRQA